MKRKVMNFDSFIEQALDRISSSGEHFGFKLGSMGRSAKRVAFGIIVLAIFGVVAFLWAVIQGIKKKQ